MTNIVALIIHTELWLIVGLVTIDLFLIVKYRRAIIQSIMLDTLVELKKVDKLNDTNNNSDNSTEQIRRSPIHCCFTYLFKHLEEPYRKIYRDQTYDYGIENIAPRPQVNSVLNHNFNDKYYTQIPEQPLHGKDSSTEETNESTK